MIRFRATTFLLLLALTSLYALAQTPSAATPARAERPATAAITGKVVDERGQPLSNAIVYARAAGANGGQRSLTTVTDREGSFKFDDLERASYFVSASLPAYTTPLRDLTAEQPATYRPGDSVTLTLIKGGVITGTVTNVAGEPLVGILVKTQMLRDANGRRITNSYGQSKLTDDRGIYRIYGLTAGTYVVLAGGTSQYFSNVSAFDSDAPTYAPSATRDTAAEITVRTGEEVAGVDIRYRAERGRIVSGQVTAAAESFPSNVALISAEQTGASWSNSQYQPPGSHAFAFNGVPDGDYAVLAESSSATGGRNLSVKRIAVRGADVTGVELVMKPLASIAGRVVLEDSKVPECAGKPRPSFEDILIYAWHNDNEAAKEIPQLVWSIGAPAKLDAEGKFTLQNLMPAEYYFASRLPVKFWYPQSIQFVAAPVAGAKVASKPIDATRVWTRVKAGDKLTGLTITYAQGGASLRGQVTLGEGEQLPPKLFVYFVPVEREKAEDVLRYFAVPVSPEGKIALMNIAPGRYWAVAQTVADDSGSPPLKFRQPNEIETRARLRHDAEATKTEIELKPCQSVTDFRLPLKPSPQ